jgi:hypothetical protein
MNSYGMQAKAHWQRWLPTRYASLTDPDSHFTELGREVETRIGELTMELAGPDQPSEGYLEKVGRLNNARSRATEIVLRESVLLGPEPETREPTEELDSDGASPGPAGRAMLTDWIPVVEDPTDPYWSPLHEEQGS